MVCLEQPSADPWGTLVASPKRPWASVTERQHRAPAHASREVKVIIVPIQDASFDDKATRVMGAAFDQACSSLGHPARAEKVRVLLAKRIIEAARNGELDPVRLHSQALMGFSIDDVSMLVVSVGRTAPIPAYAVVAHAA